LGKAARGQNQSAYKRLDEDLVLLPDQVLEVRMRAGQVNLLRRPRFDDPEDIPPTKKEFWGWDDD